MYFTGTKTSLYIPCQQQVEFALFATLVSFQLDELNMKILKVTNLVPKDNLLKNIFKGFV